MSAAVAGKYFNIGKLGYWVNFKYFLSHPESKENTHLQSYQTGKQQNRLLMAFAKFLVFCSTMHPYTYYTQVSEGVEKGREQRWDLSMLSLPAAV